MISSQCHQYYQQQLWAVISHYISPVFTMGQCLYHFVLSEDAPASNGVPHLEISYDMGIPKSRAIAPVTFSSTPVFKAYASYAP